MRFGLRPKELEVGKLYTADLSSYRGNWDRASDATRDVWHGKPIIYLGQDVLIRDDGIEIRNEKFLVQGHIRLADRTFLKFIREMVAQ